MSDSLDDLINALPVPEDPVEAATDTMGVAAGLLGATAAVGTAIDLAKEFGPGRQAGRGGLQTGWQGPVLNEQVMSFLPIEKR